MGNEVTKKDIDALNKRIDAVSKEVKSLTSDIEDYSKRVKVHIETMHKEITVLDGVDKNLQKAIDDLKKR